LLQIVLILVAEEFESAVTSRVHTPESHVDPISEPRIQAVHRVYQIDHWRFSPRFQGQLERILLGYKGHEVVKVCEGRRTKDYREGKTHAWGHISSFSAGELDSVQGKHVCGRRNEFDAFGNGSCVGNLDCDFVDAIYLVVLEVDRGGFNPKRRLFLNFIGFSTIFNGRGHQNWRFVDFMARVFQV